MAVAATGAVRPAYVELRLINAELLLHGSVQTFCQWKALLNALATSLAG